MLREVFLEPTWRDGQDAPAAPKPRQVSAVPAYCPPVDRSRLEEPADDRAALLSARLLLSAQSPPASPSALHWSRRPAAPHPPAFLTRAVQPKDLLTFGDQSAARGAGYAARGDWRRAFRSYVVAAEILRQLLAGDEPSQELRDRARRRLEVVLSIAEELKQAHPGLLLLSPSRRASEVAIARAWGDVDASTAGAQAVLAGEENRAGNALFKAGCGPIPSRATAPQRAQADCWSLLPTASTATRCPDTRRRWSWTPPSRMCTATVRWRSSGRTTSPLRCETPAPRST